MYPTSAMKAALSAVSASKALGNTVVVSLTYLRLSPALSFAADALAYQKQPAKKLNKHMV